MSLATGPVTGQLTCLPFDPDESRVDLWGPQRLECLLGEPIDPAMRTSGEGVATAVQIIDVLGPAWLARGLRGEAADANFGRKAETRM